MKNVQMTVEGHKLTITVDLSGALRGPTTVGTVLLESAGDDQRRLGRVEDRGPWHCSWSHARYREVSEMAKLMESLRLLLARIRRLIVGGR